MTASDQVQGESDADVVVAHQVGLVVLQGAKDAVAQLVANDPALNAARPSVPKRSGAASALSRLAALAPGSGSTQMVFQLDDVGMKLFQQGQLADKGGGWMRLVGRAADGTFSAQGAIKPLLLAPQEVLTAQMALTTLALTASIKAVQEAVERVEDKVDLLADLIDSTRVGDVIGAHRSLSRRAENVGFEGVLADTDWLAIDDVGIQVEQQIEALHSFVRKRLVAAEGQGERIAGRNEALDAVRELGEALSLLVVAQDSLFLFQQLRLTRIRGAEPQHLEKALAEARQLMDEHASEDAQLLTRVREVVAGRVSVKALEIHRVFTARSIVDTAVEVDAMLVWFAGQRTLSYAAIEVPALPGIDDAVDELRSRGGDLASGGWRAARSAAGRLRFHDGDELQPGSETKALASGSESGDGAPGAEGRPVVAEVRSRLRNRFARHQAHPADPAIATGEVAGTDVSDGGDE